MNKALMKTVVASVVMVLLFGGCAGVAKKSPEELIGARLNEFKAGLESKNIDAVMKTISEQFTNSEYGDKAGLRDFIAQAADMGYLDGIQVNVLDAKIKVDGKKATAYPVELKGSFGQITMEMGLANEGKNGWMITSIESSGM